MSEDNGVKEDDSSPHPTPKMFCVELTATGDAARFAVCQTIFEFNPYEGPHSFSNGALENWIRSNILPAAPVPHWLEKAIGESGNDFPGSVHIDIDINKGEKPDQK